MPDAITGLFKEAYDTFPPQGLVWYSWLEDPL
jgi:hypothetical protein